MSTKLRLELSSCGNKKRRKPLNIVIKSVLWRVRARRNAKRALPHKLRLLCNLSSPEKSSSSRGEALKDAKFPPSLPPLRQKQPGGPETRGGVGERVRSPTEARAPSVATCRGEGREGGGKVAHATGGFLCSCSQQPVFLDIIAAHVSLTAADWLDVRDQHKVTVIKLDVTAKYFRWQRRYIYIFFF